MSADGETVKGIFGILIIGILAIMAMNQGLDGEILKYAIGAILLLALGEKAVDYYFRRKALDE